MTSFLIQYTDFNYHHVWPCSPQVCGFVERKMSTCSESDDRWQHARVMHFAHSRNGPWPWFVDSSAVLRPGTNMGLSWPSLALLLFFPSPAAVLTGECFSMLMLFCFAAKVQSFPLDILFFPLKSKNSMFRFLRYMIASCTNSKILPQAFWNMSAASLLKSRSIRSLLPSSSSSSLSLPRWYFLLAKDARLWKVKLKSFFLFSVRVKLTFHVC